MAESVVILSVGARTPLGFSLAASAAAVRAGISAIGDHPFMIDRFGQCMKVTRDIGLDPQANGVDREIELALSAARDALQALSDVSDLPPVTLLLSTGESRPGKVDGHADAVYQAMAAQLRPAMGGAIAEGTCGGLMAIHHAAVALSESRAELCLAGGVDSYLVPETMEWLDESERLHSEGNIYGFCPGEGAAFCLMARAETAARLGLAPLVSVLASETGTEENRIGTETICLGEGLGMVLAKMRDNLPDPEHPVDRILCDMNGERYRGNEYGFAVLRSSGLFRDAAGFETPADCWGDLGAATGPACIGLVAEAHARGYAKGPLSLVWGSSDNGSRAAVMVADARRDADA
ncbi:beta-ketoacyl synthase N-terminal-like domain-containing protein [Ruegeria marina]|nr:beta-ketoacyl synthase N-terminal-like domain-containing protein [Ruegeria marina]